MSEEERQPRLAPEVAQPSGDKGRRAPEMAVSGQTEPLVLSRGNLFSVTNQRGDIAPAGARDLGLFHDDTRHLSYLELFIAGGPPLVLSADTHGATSAQIDLTLTDSQFGGFFADPQNFLHIRRKQMLDGEGLIEQLVLTNHLRRAVRLWVELRMAADFADIFEVRGAPRTRRGALRQPRPGADELVLSYQGLDGLTYRTTARMTPEPKRVGPSGPFWDLHLQPGEATVLETLILPSRGEPTPAVLAPYDVRLQRVRREHQAFVESTTRISTNNTSFEEALGSALGDLESLRVDVGARPILGAGIPWFAAPFGRDSLITALELLSVAPDLAVDVLRTLGALQGQKDDPWREEEPGKILHELRRGEMVRSGEVPHSPYYGSIDSTPLWLVLLGETWRWLGDRALLAELRPNAEAALAWIERRLDQGAGFVRYQRTHDRGLENQGWKDSRDGVSFPDGAIAQPPIALIEVQGYVVAAFEAAAEVLAALGERERPVELRDRAERLREEIERAFFVPEAGYYALALDGDGNQVPTITSNPGHLLFCGAVRPDTGQRIAEVLLSDELYSGFGVRTLARGQAVYNPLSYHNGSVWPHDNALCALGLQRLHRGDAALQLFEGLYQAGRHFRRHRLPELFCGLGRGEGDFLVHYPVSCSPQAWASGAWFLLLQATLGLQPDAPAGVLRICDPQLPSFVDRLDLAGMRVGAARVWLHFRRHEGRTHVDVARQEGPLHVRIELGTRSPRESVSPIGS